MQEGFTYTKKLLGTDNTMGLFVSLYLILLAFFIILNAISNQMPERADATIESVKDAFSGANPAPSPNIVFPDTSGQTKPLDDLLTSLQGQFFAEFEVPGRFSAEGGKSLEFTIPLTYFFNRGSFAVSQTRQTFLETVVSTLNAAEAGAQLDVAFMFGSGNDQVQPELTRSQEIAIRRAGSLARAIRDSGLKAGQFSTGFTTVPEDEILVIFRERISEPGVLILEPQAGSDG